MAARPRPALLPATYRIADLIASATQSGIASESPSVRLARALRLLFDHSDDPQRDCHLLAGPLSQVIIFHKSRLGQALCAEFGAALADGSRRRALSACHRLIAEESAYAYRERRRKRA